MGEMGSFNKMTYARSSVKGSDYNLIGVVLSPFFFPRPLVLDVVMASVWRD